MRVSPDKVSPRQGARTSGTGITHAFGRFESSGRYHSKVYVFLYKKPMAGYLADRVFFFCFFSKPKYSRNSVSCHKKDIR